MKKIQIPEYQYYYISKDGKIYNSNNSFKELKSHQMKNGYQLVVLNNKNIKPKGLYIHRLVAQHYIPNPNNFPEINHKNKIRNDNRIENLEWCSKEQNTKHKYLDLIRL